MCGKTTAEILNLWLLLVLHCKYKIQIGLIILYNAQHYLKKKTKKQLTTSPPYVRHSWNTRSMNGLVNVPMPYLNVQKHPRGWILKRFQHTPEVLFYSAFHYDPHQAGCTALLRRQGSMQTILRQRETYRKLCVLNGLKTNCFAGHLQ